MPSYDTIVIKDGVIEGELADGGVVTIPNKAWTEIDEDSLEGNWEQVTRTIVEDVIDARSLETDHPWETLSVDYDRFVDTLADSSIVEHKEPKTERQRAELLLEYLTREGVYERRGPEIVVLDELDAPSDEFAKLNWTVFFSHASEEIDSVIQGAESQREAAEEMNENETQAQLAIDIRRMSRVKLLFSEFEQELRETAIIDVADIPEEIQHIQKLADSVLVGETNEQSETFADSVLAGNTEDRITKETAESIIKQFAQQEGIDLTGDVETADKQLNERCEPESATDEPNEVAEIDRLSRDSSQE